MIRRHFPCWSRSTMTAAFLLIALVAAATAHPLDIDPSPGDSSAGEPPPVVSGLTADDVAAQIWSGWFREPAGGKTDVPPTAAELYGKLHVFAKGIDDRRVYVQTFGAEGWDGTWLEVPGRVMWAPSVDPVPTGTRVFPPMRTGLSPAATRVGSRLYLVAKALRDGRLYANVKTSGGDPLAGWDGWRPLPPGATDAAAAAAGTTSTVHVFRKGLDDRVYLTRGGSFWTPWKLVGGPFTDLAPAAAADPSSGTVWLFRVEKLTGTIFVNTLSGGLASAACAVDGVTRTDAPVTAVWDGQTVRLFLKGLDGRIYVQTLVDRRPYGQPCSFWSVPMEVRGDGLIDAAPAAAYFGAVARLVVLAKGLGVPDIYYNVATVLEIPIHAIRVADGDGATCAPPVADVYEADVTAWVRYANRAFAPAFIRFRFDPATDWEGICDSRLNKSRPELGVATAEAAEHPGKIVVFFRARANGNGYSWWEPGSAEPWDRVNFVLMPGFRETWVCGHRNIAQLAHDLGHYLGLPHTFLGKDTPFMDPGTKSDASDDTPDPDAARLWLLDGHTMDGDGFSDTPEDPGIAIVNQCGPDPVFFEFDMGPDLPSRLFTPPRTNVMSYYSDNWDTFGQSPLIQTVTPQQIQHVYQTIAERGLLGTFFRVVDVPGVLRLVDRVD